MGSPSPGLRPLSETWIVRLLLAASLAAWGMVLLALALC